MSGLSLSYALKLGKYISYLYYRCIVCVKRLCDIKMDGFTQVYLDALRCGDVQMV